MQGHLLPPLLSFFLSPPHSFALSPQRLPLFFPFWGVSLRLLRHRFSNQPSLGRLLPGNLLLLPSDRYS